jgi:superfamily II DNA/RNA helicase
MAQSIGTLTDAAMNRVVNLHAEGTKLDWTEKYVGGHQDEPTVIFAHNLESVRAITKRLKAQGHSVGVITGEMSTKAKDKAKEAFTGSEPTANVLVCSDASAMGANLQRGYHMINFDTPMTSMLHEQRIAREVRCGQKNIVSVHDLVADCGFDRRNRKRLERKAALRELMTTPAELVDDTGLCHRIEAEKVRAALGGGQQNSDFRHAA